eukprot:TRINITY_DN7100_c0_g1_i1.p3 TRINITY_DN7100_c0_g1~~TRINITY_DN7100_c0_g1_i1.p3  ORF type:complete len:127 (-),score=44.58 TRINITY_DN7100_c0_g1_i1:29-409(-)
MLNRCSLKTESFVLALNDVSAELHTLAVRASQQASHRANQRHLRAFEAAHPDVAKSLRSLVEETVAECETLEQQVQDVRARVCAKQRAADKELVKKHSKSSSSSPKPSLSRKASSSARRKAKVVTQ